MTKRYVVRGTSEVWRNPHEGMRIYVLAAEEDKDESEWKSVAMFRFREHADRYCAELNREEEAKADWRSLTQTFDKMLQDERFRSEVEYLYGGSALGLVERVSYDAGRELTVTITANTWAPALWSAGTIAVDAYSHDGHTKRNQDGPIVIRGRSTKTERAVVMLAASANDATAIVATDAFVLAGKGEMFTQHKDAIPPPAYTFIEESAPFDAALSEALDAVIAPLRVRPDADASWCVETWAREKVRAEKPQPPTEGERVRCCRAHADPCWMFNDEVWKSLKERCER